MVSSRRPTPFGLYVHQHIATASVTNVLLLLQPNVAVDGNLITGQNPASAGPIGEAILKALKL